ncbi:MAG: hypothetical protein DHS20C18_00910 [Saprospiraceae bacterium]|nr:MAG: hypothetical protein DHS20C18_00910 [Saprospiraceae bacterium]
MCYNKAYHQKWGGHSKHAFRHFAREKWGGQFQHKWQQVPVNVRENDDNYELYVYAAGYNKTDFEIKMKDNVLVITAKGPEIVEDAGWSRQEFTPVVFERRFELNEKIDKDAISAKYEDGILKVTLPKLAGFESMSSDIVVD